MITVMLVDDEPIEREGLRLMLEKNREKVQIVAEAQNGKKAVELALTHQPDLIFMDIKMPEMDGLAAIKQILAERPSTKCIMVSAFDTFDYAREAMKFGIKEYLLKPSKLSEVLEAFDRMAAEVEMEREQEAEKSQISHRLKQVSSLIETEFIVSLMLDYVYEFSEDDWQDWLNLENKQGFAVVFSFETEQLYPDREKKADWYQKLKECLQHAYPHCLVGPLTGFQVPAFVFLEQVESATELRDTFARTMIRQVEPRLDCPLFIGVGSIVSAVQDFSQSYEQAIYALESVRNHQGASYMVFTNQLQEKRKALVPFAIEKELIEAVKKGDIQQGLQKFDAYYSVILQAADYQLRPVRKTMENLFILLTRTMNELGYEENIQTDFDRLDTITQIKEVARAHLSAIIEKIRDWRMNGVEGLLLQAKDFIDHHYERPISLEEVAEKIGLSSYYLSKLFKEQFQISFIEYVTQLRIRKAKDFLLEGTLSLKEIALTIGYKDPNYFSRVFKKETGLSPREYRSRYQK